jgi:hypothetical protein
MTCIRCVLNTLQAFPASLRGRFLLVLSPCKRATEGYSSAVPVISSRVCGFQAAEVTSMTRYAIVVFPVDFCMECQCVVRPGEEHDAEMHGASLQDAIELAAWRERLRYTRTSDCEEVEVPNVVRQ